RAIGPEPDRVRGLPFLLAHIEVLVARGAAPVDAARRLPRQEAAVLPEIFARTRSFAAVQSMDEGGRDAACLEDEARQGPRKRARLTARVQRSLDLVLVRAPLCRCHSTIRCAP